MKIKWGQTSPNIARLWLALGRALTIVEHAQTINNNISWGQPQGKDNHIP